MGLCAPLISQTNPCAKCEKNRNNIKDMNIVYTIKNFRVFDKNGATMPIKPLTILTGCNSSGKSSIVKSIILLNGFLNDRAGLYRRYGKEAKLDFSDKSNAVLGSFNRVLHHGSDSSELVFEYNIHSLEIGDDVVVCLTFEADEKDYLNDGFAKSIEIRTKDGNVLYHSDAESFYSDFNYLIFNFYRFIYGQYLIDISRDIDSQKKYSQAPGDSIDDYNHFVSSFKNDYEKRYGETVLYDIIKSMERSSTSLINRYFSHDIDVVSQAYKAGTIFYHPIIESLDKIKKEEIREHLLPDNAEIEDKDRELIEYVICDFTNSYYSTFGEYYRSKEKEFFCYKDKKKGPSFFDDIGWNINYFIWYLGNQANVECLPQEDPQIMQIHLGTLYYVFTVLGEIMGTPSYPYYSKIEEKQDYFKLYNRMFEMFKHYLSLCLLNISSPFNISYISSSIVDIKRLYSLERDDSMSKLLKNYFDARRAFEKNKLSIDTYTPCRFVNHWFQKLDIGYSVEINTNEIQSGVTIKIFRDKRDKKGCLLAELGYGITQLFVILLRIDIAIMEAETSIVSKDKDYLGDPSELPEHQRQILRTATTLAIEEPEVHQHPRYQSALAEIFVDAMTKYNVNFIIETHSEYIIRKLQLLVAKKNVNPSDISLLYVYDEKNRPKHEPHIKQINIRKDGMLDGSFGDGFFDEADMLSMFLLTAGKEEDE
jgi:AAA15 family ATPase/GTPase